MNVFDVTLLLLGLLFAVPSGTFFLECLASLLPARRMPGTDVNVQAARAVVLVPAHDEALQIAATVEALRRELGPADEVVVVADNCTDETANLAQSAGARVYERHDPSRRGKGHALTFGLAKLADAPPEVVIIVDADCRVAEGAILALKRQALATGRPAQAEYLLRPTALSPGAVVSTLAFLVRNRVRMRGLDRLGGPSPLVGTGMAFPYRVLRDAPDTGSHLTEDLLMGIQLAERGTPARFCPAAYVESDLPVRSGAARKQRARWEHGHLSLLLREGPRLVGRGLLRGRPALVGLGLDLMVPPLSLLVLLVGSLVLSTGLSFAVGGALLPWIVAMADLAAVGFGVLLGWLRHGRSLVPARYLLAVPLYLAWKVPLYLGLAVGRRQKTWERTERAATERV